MLLLNSIGVVIILSGAEESPASLKYNIHWLLARSTNPDNQSIFPHHLKAIRNPWEKY